MKSHGPKLEVDEQARHHFSAFVDAFVSQQLGERWVTLFDAARSASWRKIDPWSLWDTPHQRAGARYEEVQDDVRSLLSSTVMRVGKDAPVVIFHLGHSKPAIHRIPLHQITPQDWPLEGLVSIVPGSRAVVVNHDGGILLCTPGRAERQSA